MPKRCRSPARTRPPHELAAPAFADLAMPVECLRGLQRSLQGTVTSVINARHFQVRGVTVNASTANLTLPIGMTSLSQGTFVSVLGTLDESGNMMATQVVATLTPADGKVVEFVGLASQYDAALQTFMLSTQGRVNHSTCEPRWGRKSVTRMAPCPDSVRQALAVSPFEWRASGPTRARSVFTASNSFPPNLKQPMAHNRS